MQEKCPNMAWESYNITGIDFLAFAVGRLFFNSLSFTSVVSHLLRIRRVYFRLYPAV